MEAFLAHASRMAAGRGREAKRHTILFLAADPSGTERLALDREARAIHVELKRSGFRDRFDFQTRWAAEPLDLLRELRELKPTVLHFSGRGVARIGVAPSPVNSRDVVTADTQSRVEPGSLYLHDAAGCAQAVSADAIAQALGAAGASVKLVVLNACYTTPIAEALLAHVDCVVGMRGSIHDDAARSFAIGFYGGLGEHEPIEAAFKQGRAAINLSGLPEADLPQLHVRQGLDAAQLILAATVPSVLVDALDPGMRPTAAKKLRRYIRLGILLSAIMVTGSSATWWLWRRSSFSELSRVLNEVEVRKAWLTSQQVALQVYKKYHFARRKQREQFWSDPNLAGRGGPHGIGTADVAYHNELLRLALGAAPLQACHRGGPLALCRYFATLDEALQEVKSPSATGVEEQAATNDRLCRYWELVFCEPHQQTYLTEALVDCQQIHELTLEVNK